VKTRGDGMEMCGEARDAGGGAGRHRDAEVHGDAYGTGAVVSVGLPRAGRLVC